MRSEHGPSASASRRTLRTRPCRGGKPFVRLDAQIVGTDDGGQDREIGSANNAAVLFGASTRLNDRPQEKITTSSRASPESKSARTPSMSSASSSRETPRSAIIPLSLSERDGSASFPAPLSRRLGDSSLVNHQRKEAGIRIRVMPSYDGSIGNVSFA